MRRENSNFTRRAHDLATVRSSGRLPAPPPARLSLHPTPHAHMPSKTVTTLALEPSDFVLVALLGFVLLVLLPRHLLHYWGRSGGPGVSGDAATVRGKPTGTSTRRRRA